MFNIYMVNQKSGLNWTNTSSGVNYTYPSKLYPLGTKNKTKNCETQTSYFTF